MKPQLLHKQSGLSFFGVLVMVAILAFVGLIGAQVVPTYLEYMAIQKAAKKAVAQASTVEDVKNIFGKAAQVDDIKSVAGKDLVVEKVGEQIVASFAYSKEFPIFGPAYLVMKYEGKTSD
jgi:Domain of unknown function (DUF4845)